MNDKIDREYMIRFFKEPKGPPFPLLYFKKAILTMLIIECR